MKGEGAGALADNHGRRLSVHTIVMGALPPSLDCPFPGPGFPQGFNGATVGGRALRDAWKIDMENRLEIPINLLGILGQPLADHAGILVNLLIL